MIFNKKTWNICIISEILEELYIYRGAMYILNILLYQLVELLRHAFSREVTQARLR